MNETGGKKNEENPNSNRIVRRYCIEADILLETPLSISSGMDEGTDADVLRNAEGKPFIPGSSLAGAFRHYIKQPKDKPCPLGYSDQGNGSMSSIWIMDAYLKDCNVSIRDGVSLNDDKSVENKFDYEVVDSGASATLRMERIVREKDLVSNNNVTKTEPARITEKEKEKNADRELKAIRIFLTALDEGEIRMGHKKNRGFGWMSVEKVRKKCFSRDNAEEWIKYCGNAAPDSKTLLDDWDNWRIQGGKDGAKFASMKIPLRLTGGISIRKYSTRPGEADFEHITVQKRSEDGKGVEVPVIPGTSWSGAVRSCTRNILRELGADQIDNILDTWFGFVDKDKKGKGSHKDRACQSMAVFRESVLEDSVPMQATRNKINRFDASTSEGALYTDRSYFGGRTTLEILVSKSDETSYKALVGILLLAVQEIEEGFLPVGGQVAIGRGIFEKDPGKSTEYSEDISSDEQRKGCMEELQAILFGREDRAAG